MRDRRQKSTYELVKLALGLDCFDNHDGGGRRSGVFLEISGIASTCGKI